MNRKHAAKDYLDIIDRLRKARPDIAFSSDFIVGFPGETQKDHQDTLELVRQVNFAQAYSFKYSIRPGTPAGSMDQQVPEAIKTERLYELQDLLNEQQWAFNKTKVGTIQPVLFDRVGKTPGQVLGKTPYMQSVPLVAPQRLVGSLVDVLVKEGYANSLMGVIIDSNEPVASAA